MKNLLTLLLLFISLLAFGQSNNQSVEVEIKYWKSIAESNDTVAYREYLQRYGEDGLYKDEAITRIALLKTVEKNTQSKSTEICFYYNTYIYDWDSVEYTKMYHGFYYKPEDYVEFVIKFDSNKDCILLRAIQPNYKGVQSYSESYKGSFEIVRSKLAMSQNYYENDTWGISGDAEYKFDQMKSTSARDVYFNRTTIPEDYHIRNHGYLIQATNGYSYMAISKDKSSIITWFEPDNNYDGQIWYKMKYQKVPKEKFFPKAVNYDFLNE